MKKRIIHILAIALVVSAFVIPAAPDANAAVSFSASAYVSSTGGANLRKGPSIKTKRVGYLKNGSKLTIYREHFVTNSRAAKNRWYYVKSGKQSGYIRGDLVKGLKHSKTRVVWAKDALNFRNTPGTNSDVLGTYPKNSAFYVVLTATARGSDKTWYKVRNGSTFYYVTGAYITFTKPKGGASKVTTKIAVKPTGSNVKQSAASRRVAEGAVAWAIRIANDNTFHYGNGYHAHHNGCYFCGTQPSSKRRYVVGWEKTYCCNPFVHAAYAHGGKEPTMLRKCQGYGSYDWDDYKKSKLFAKLGHPAKSTLVKGDVLCLDGHVAMYIGNGQLVEAGFSDDGVRYSRSWNNSISVSRLTDGRYREFTHIYRYIGKN